MVSGVIPAMHHQARQHCLRWWSLPPTTLVDHSVPAHGLPLRGTA